MADSYIYPSAALKSAQFDAFVKKTTEEVLYPQHILMAALKSRGRIKFNKGDYAIRWKPAYKRSSIVAGPANPASRSFPQRNFWKEATLPWREYHDGFGMEKFEELANKGPGKFFDLLEARSRITLESFAADLNLRLYYDGNSSSTPKDIHGLRSWDGHTGSCLTGMAFADPDDNYAGLNTDLQAYGGSWDPPSGKSWPRGTGTPPYYFWSPKIVDYNNSGVGWTGDTWRENWQEALNYGETFMKTLHGKKPDLWIVEADMERICKDSLKSLQTLEVTQNSPLTKLGHKTLTYNGIELASEYGVPEDEGWGIYFGDIELWSMQKQLIMQEKDYDITTATRLVALDSYLQMITWTPARQLKLEGVSTAGS